METEQKVGRKIRPLYILIAAIVVIAAVGIIYFVVNASGQVVAVGDTVNVTYTGSFVNGTVFNSNVGGQPLKFTVGSGELIKGFDQGVIGMRLNEQKTITIPVNEAYGPVNPALILEIPSNTFGNQTVNVGMNITSSENGQEVRGVVIAVNKTVVIADFNPLLAGKTLVFEIKVLSIHKG
jgi:peptidylprolyl isomerase